MMSLEIVILAAGHSRRMKSRLPKVFHHAAGKTLLDHVLDTAAALAPERIHVLVGPEYREHPLASRRKGLTLVVQDTPRGTGHALMTALPGIPDDDSLVLTLYGDMPLLRPDSLKRLLAMPAAGKTGVFILSAFVQDPTGFGRVVRKPDGTVAGIVEEVDASDAQRRIDEIHTGVCMATAGNLRSWLAEVDNCNAQREYYLPRILEIAAARGTAIHHAQLDDPRESLGVNDRTHLAAVEWEMQRRAAHDLMMAGVTLADPQRLTVRGEVVAGEDCLIDVGVVLEGKVVLAAGVQIGAYSILRDSQVRAGAVIHPYSHIENSVVDEGAMVGPYARLRTGTRLGRNVTVGNFIEIKNTTIEPDSKAMHLGYLGDTEIGEKCNIGAGTVTCNYDGLSKYPTKIGDGVFVGSNTTLVAKTTVEDRAYIAAGSTITKPVREGELGIGRGPQRNISDWPSRRRSPKSS